MPRIIVALLVALVASTAPLVAHAVTDAGASGDVVTGTHVGELKDELIEDRFSCGGASHDGLTPLAGALGLAGVSAWRRRRRGRG